MIQLRALFACLLLAALIYTPSFAYEVEEETGSLLLTELNFEDTVNKEDYLLVNFHALWCRYSKALKPEWKTLSEKLKDPLTPVKLAKVEAYDEKKIAEQYGIEGYPTIKLFIGGTPHDYKGERNAASILEFVNRKLKNSLTVVSDKNAIENKLKDYEWVGVSIGDTDNDIVKDIAFDMQDVLFVRISASAGKNLYSDTTDAKFVLVNNITGDHDNFKGAISEDLVEFINDKKFPPVARISKGTVEKIFLSEEPVLLLVRRESGDDKAEKAFNDARKNKDLKGIFMAIANTKEDVDNRLASNLGLDSTDLPAVCSCIEV